nr:MAG TPA: hypothetical protein [Caudoviricetes sp.]
MMTKDEIDAFCEKCPDCGKRECSRIGKCAECPNKGYGCMVEVCVLEHKGFTFAAPSFERRRI